MESAYFIYIYHSQKDPILERLAAEPISKYVTCLEYKPMLNKIFHNNNKNVVVTPPCFLLTLGKVVKIYSPEDYVLALRTVLVYVNTGTF